jgi:hypothetical protein
MNIEPREADYLRCDHLTCDKEGNRTHHKSINKAKAFSRTLRPGALRVVDRATFNREVSRRSGKPEEALPEPKRTRSAPRATKRVTEAAQRLADGFGKLGAAAKRAGASPDGLKRAGASRKRAAEEA